MDIISVNLECYKNVREYQDIVQTGMRRIREERGILLFGNLYNFH
jgi:hypothetical protein